MREGEGGQWEGGEGSGHTGGAQWHVAPGEPPHLQFAARCPVPPESRARVPTARAGIWHLGKEKDTHIEVGGCPF